MNCVGKAMLKKATFIVMVMVMTLLANKTKAGGSVVVNGSFEYDCRTIDPITADNTPERWDDVNLPENQFSGRIWTDWPTDGHYNLTIYSYIYASFDVNDMATVSQQVYLTDVNEIGFDLKLETYPASQPWDPSKRTAVLMIDDNVVWESNSIGLDVRGEYFDQFYIVDDKYKTAGTHKLSLGIRANVNEEMSLVHYRAKWDFVRFDAHCWGYGYLRADLTGPDGRRDCYVDEFDLAMLAQKWLEENTAYRYDLFEDETVDFRDFGVLANSWTGDSFGLEDDLLAADLNNDGIVNLLDFAIAAEDYSGGQVNFEDVSILAEQWLQKNWLYWPE